MHHVRRTQVNRSLIIKGKICSDLRHEHGLSQMYAQLVIDLECTHSQIRQVQADETYE